jgi:hypothetical protein
VTDPARPQPVLDEAKAAGLIQAVVVAGGGLLVVIKEGVNAGNLFTLANAINVFVTAALAAGAYLLPILKGKTAAAKVTPLDAPQTYGGEPLKTAAQWQAESATAASLYRVQSAAAHGAAALDVLRTAADGARTANSDLEQTTTAISDMAIPDAPTPYYSQLAANAPTEEEPAPVTEPVTPRPLGRIVRHDPRSLQYLVPEATTPKSAKWDRKIPVLDQGNLGSCTGNATVGVLGSEPFWDTLTVTEQQSLDENEAVKVYSLATQLDDVSGTYPPDDTGSSGLAAAQAAKKLGFISGYMHITSVAAAQQAIQTGPFITGVNWYEGFDSPDANGLVEISGQIRGGHEFEIIGYDATQGLWEAVNSWGTSYGVNGHMFFSDASFARLLSEQGDATTFVPLTQPAPIPTPVPTPTPTPTPTPVPPQPTPIPLGFPLAEWTAFEQHHRSEIKWLRLKEAVDAWLASS